MTSTLNFTFALPHVPAQTVAQNLGREICFSRHALQRYRERCRPGDDLHELPALLCALEPIAILHLEPPSWAHWRQTLGRAFLTIGNATFALEPDRREPRRLLATTCLTRNHRAWPLAS